MQPRVVDQLLGNSHNAGVHDIGLIGERIEAESHESRTERRGFDTQKSARTENLVDEDQKYDERDPPDGLHRNPSQNPNEDKAAVVADADDQRADEADPMAERALMAGNAARMPSGITMVHNTARLPVPNVLAVSARSSGRVPIPAGNRFGTANAKKMMRIRAGTLRKTFTNVPARILETYGIDPTYRQIRDEWVDHLNGDIWVATLKARELMDDGHVPPMTSDPKLNPDGSWAMDAQLETELFGLLSPGLPDVARRQATFFATVTSRGPAVEASAFYAQMYAEAFTEGDVAALIASARADEADDSVIGPIVDDVVGWHREHPDDWRSTRRLIRDAYDTDTEFWASRVNYAVTIMALLYGGGDLRHTINIAGLAGWDADNNMTTTAGLLGVIIGHESLPEPFASATDVYFNEDLTGDLPRFDSVGNIAARTVRLGEQVLAAR